MRQLIECIRRIPCYTNEHCYQLSIQRCDKYGFHLFVFPSERWQWWGESDLDYFRCYAIALKINFVVRVVNGMPVADFTHYE